MLTFFVPDSESSPRYLPLPGLLLKTPDLELTHFKWTRFVQGTYHPERGFLAMDGITRIPIEIYIKDASNASYTLHPKYAVFAKELNDLLLPKTLTAIHYRPNRTVDSIIVGVHLDVESTYPWHLKHTLCTTDDT